MRTTTTLAMSGLVLLTATVLGLLSERTVQSLIPLDWLSAVSIILILALLLAHLVTRPLAQLNRAVQAFPRDANAILLIPTTGEIGVLASAFKEMAIEIRDKSAALNKELGKQTDTEADIQHYAQQERVFGAVFEVASYPIITKMIDGTITGWNPAAERLYKYTAAEAIGRKVDIIIPPERSDEYKAILGKVCRGELIEEFETTRMARDGQKIAVSLSIHPIRSRTGEIIAVAKITRDITAKKFADEKFHLAVESCPSGMVMIDSTGKIVMVNGEIERLFGYPRAELIGQPIDMLVPESVRLKHVRHRDGFAHNPEARRMGAGRDLFGRRKDGSEFPVEVGLNPIKTRENLMVLGVVVDITERKKAEEMFRLVVEACPNGMVIVNSTGQIVMVNKETERLFGYRREELIGRPVDILVPAQVRSQHAEHRELFTRQPEARRMGANRNLFGVRKDSTEFPVEVGLNPIQTHKGVLVLSVIVDISERKRIERLKDDFVATVSHELRTPLTSISASLGLLNGNADIKLPEAQKRLIAIAHSNTERLVRLINDILDMEKIESGKVAFNLQRIEVRSLIEQTIESSQALADSNGVSLRFADSSNYEVRADPDRLVQVVTNLISNAIKFSPQGSSVELAIESLEYHIRIAVRNHGPGIPEEFKPRIFEMFAQADASNEPRRGGTGLGLSIVKQIILRLGGQVGFADAPGGGTIFYVDLPRLDTASPTIAPSEEISNGARILLCEEDSDAATVMRERLHEAGFAIDLSHSATSAVARTTMKEYSAVLVGLQFHDGDGISLIQQLRGRPQYSDTPIVVVSENPGRGRDDLRPSNLSVLDWLSKPLDVSRLMQSLRSSITHNGSAKLRVLHVDDDLSVLGIVAQALNGDAQVISVATVKDARRALATSHVDLAIIGLEVDGSKGFDLLPELQDSAGEAIPVIVYSAQGSNPACAAQVKAALTKSRASIDSLIRTLRKCVTASPQNAPAESELA